jgi:hypothetical protein
MQRKEVYVNDQLVGEARTWSEVDALLESGGILFLDTPGAAEGPTGFYISGAFARRGASRFRRTSSEWAR